MFGGLGPIGLYKQQQQFPANVSQIEQPQRRNKRSRDDGCDSMEELHRLEIHVNMEGMELLKGAGKAAWWLIIISLSSSINSTRSKSTNTVAPPHGGTGTRGCIRMELQQLKRQLETAAVTRHDPPYRESIPDTDTTRVMDYHQKTGILPCDGDLPGCFWGRACSARAGILPCDADIPECFWGRASHGP